ncbi:hypothetical protein Q0F99_10390 [Rathayibacter oskolensis]|uniref:hypothetical protein n=1 Tax=Rathayibacter oskolensis TaxID=1891671 RepID=UPI00265F7580|nr:hypothetical protein [Rathayibacter oskolensis]WKK70308.1 hypothetical protein Q0F99_10390 [Rathayibacter oskolensis]
MKEVARFLAGFVLAGSLVLGTGVMQATAAQDCKHGGNPGATACMFGVTHGAFTNFHNNKLIVNGALEAQQYHANQSIWTYSSDACSAEIETGVTQGYHGQIAYVYYGAWVRNTYGYGDTKLSYTSPNGTDHKYNLRYMGPNGSYEGVFAAYRDNAQQFSVNHLGYGACQSEVGLELSGGTSLSNYQVDTFDDVNTGWQDTSYVPHTGGLSGTYNDRPCGVYSVPNCMNGVLYSAAHWANNKPY